MSPLTGFIIGSQGGNMQLHCSFHQCYILTTAVICNRNCFTSQGAMQYQNSLFGAILIQVKNICIATTSKSSPRYPDIFWVYVRVMFLVRLFSHDARTLFRPCLVKTLFKTLSHVLRNFPLIGNYLQDPRNLQLLSKR